MGYVTHQNNPPDFAGFVGVAVFFEVESLLLADGMDLIELDMAPAALLAPPIKYALPS